MKIGSLVECVNNALYSVHINKNTPYTVREILPKGFILTSNNPYIKVVLPDIAIRLEEVNASPKYGNTQWYDVPFPMKDFRELLPDLMNELEEILELIQI